MQHDPTFAEKLVSPQKSIGNLMEKGEGRSWKENPEQGGRLEIRIREKRPGWRQGHCV